MTTQRITVILTASALGSLHFEAAVEAGVVAGTSSHLQQFLGSAHPPQPACGQRENVCVVVPW